MNQEAKKKLKTVIPKIIKCLFSGILKEIIWHQFVIITF